MLLPLPSPCLPINARVLNLRFGKSFHGLLLEKLCQDGKVPCLSIYCILNLPNHSRTTWRHADCETIMNIAL
jgi:hypothetical protein